MKKILSAAMVCLSIGQSLVAQMDLPPSGGNPRATVSEEVGITSITIKYSRPDVNKREGKIWGDGNLVTYGFTSLNLNTNKNDMPWRAGANENTIITFEHDVKIEGKDLKAGTYGLHMALWADKATIIFSNQSEAWGSYYYDPRFDALRVDVKPVMLDRSTEWLKYEFIEHKEKSCVIALQWEKLSVPFRVDVDVDNIVMARLREQVTSGRGFNASLMQAAANFALNKNIYLEEALSWAQRAALTKSFSTLNTLGTAYTKLNKLKEADSTMNEALVFGNAAQHVGYGRSLIAAKRPDRALEVFTAAQKKFGDIYIINSGLMSYHSAKADYKKALDFANEALAQAPNDAAKTAMNGNITKLKEGKDVN
jgi:tetratricopeptide (TPR) repeat protein